MTRLQVITLTVARILLNTALRMVYPFLGVFARGLGVELRAIELTVAARSGLGVLGPFLAGPAERRGRKVAMLLALALFVAGGLVAFAWPVLTGFLIGLLLTGTAKIVYDPAVQAYVGDRVAYERRGQLLAITELAWSLSFIVGVPLAGLLIREVSWQSPFLALALLGALFIGLIWVVLPDDTPPEGAERPTLAATLRLVATTPAALAGIGIGMVISMSSEIVSIAYGVWLEVDFGLQVTALGLSAAVIGVADLLGEGVVIGFVDRIGKRRLLIGALVAHGAAGVILPLLGGTGQTGALVGLFFFFLTFEIALVTSIPLMTELVPGARATMMGGYLAASSGGRMVGALVGPALFALTDSMLGNGLAALALALAALGLLRFIRQE